MVADKSSINDPGQARIIAALQMRGPHLWQKPERPGVIIPDGPGAAGGRAARAMDGDDGGGGGGARR